MLDRDYYVLILKKEHRERIGDVVEFTDHSIFIEISGEDDIFEFITGEYQFIEKHEYDSRLDKYNESIANAEPPTLRTEVQKLIDDKPEIYGEMESMFDLFITELEKIHDNKI